MSEFFSTADLSVGYNRHVLLDGINIRLERGKILTLIGPNGAGKSTILKTITRQLAPIGGSVLIMDQPIFNIPMKTFARETAVVLTERIHPELMTCAEVVAMGRYPYTDMFGKLTETDKDAVAEALERVHAMDIAEQDFLTLSDGQRQRIMLARAICQEPEIMVLDEPTAYLDIRFKIELLNILQKMARDKGTIVIMSLHEVDLAVKISDELLCINGEKVAAYGTPESIMKNSVIESLYNISSGTYNLLFGSVELPKPEGAPEIFIIGGNGSGTPFYRELQKKGIPFATGILFANDVDCQTADALSDHVVKTPAFEPVQPETVSEAEEILLQCKYVLDPGIPAGSFNRCNAELLQFAADHKIPVRHSLSIEGVE